MDFQKKDRRSMVTLLSIKLDLSRKVSGKFMELTTTRLSHLIAMLKSVRIMLAIAAYLDYEIWQMDVKTAFLNGNLEEDVYMIQPRRFCRSKGC